MKTRAFLGRVLSAASITAASTIALFAASSSLTMTACSSDPQTDAAPTDGGNESSSGGDGSDVDAGPATPQWRTVLSGLDGALLSIWGSSEKDVWAVGGPLGNAGFEALALHFDGAAWKRLTPGKAESFWWVHGTAANDVWLVGEKGRITHWDGAAFTEMTSGTDVTLFGVWAASPSDVWAVGGTPDAPAATNDVVLHYDGVSWKPEALPEQKKVALFKVWGSSADNVYVVGEAGVIWHRTGGTWKREGESVAKSRLTTVSGCSASEVYAVGGRDVLVSTDGATWSKAPIDPLKLVNDVNGVSCSAPGKVVVVGGGSLKFRLDNGVWQSDFGSEPFPDLHGAWADPTGAYWGVGGQFIAAPAPNVKRQGVIGRYAANTVSSVLTP